MRRAQLVLVLSLVVCSACEAPDAGEVTSDSRSIAPSDPPLPVTRFTATHRLVPRVRIGRVEGPVEQTLGDVRALAVDRLNRVYIADALQQSVLVFDSSGVFVRSLGREGEGPGEFLWPSGITLQHDSTVWVLDRANQRYTAYDTSGTFLRATRRPPLGSMAPWPARFDGEYLVEAKIGADGYSLVTVDLSRTPPAIRDILVFPLAEVPLDEWNPTYSQRTEFAVRRQRIPFTEGWEWALDGQGGVWSGDTRTYRLTRRDLRGPVAGGFSHDILGASVSPVERVAAADSLVAAGWDASLIPDRKPVFRVIQVTRRGNVALLREGEGDLWTVDVLSPSGEVVQSADLPIAPDLNVLPVIHETMVWVVAEGGLGEPVVFGLTWEALQAGG